MIRNNCLILALVFAIVQDASADTIHLRNGRTLKGVILKEGSSEVVLKLKYTTATIKRDEIDSIDRTEPEALSKGSQTALASWEKCLEVAVRTDWVADLKPIPATVIDKGVLRNVPYKSFRSGNYEINIYGDPDNPCCVEIGLYNELLKSDTAKKNCLSFMSNALNRKENRSQLEGLNLSKDKKVSDGLTIEVTPEAAEDAYGGWWISAYDEEALNKARASTEEMKAITQRKSEIRSSYAAGKKDKKQQDAVKQNAEKDEDSASEYDPDNLKYSRSSAGTPTGGGAVYVRGYYRKNGTYVSPHTRSAPRSRR
jgi:hypothetical protein